MLVGERPLGVTIVGILVFLDSGLMMMIGLNTGLPLSYLGGPMSLIGILWLFCAVIGMILSRGLWSRKCWAWLATLIVTVLAAVGLIGGWIALIPQVFRGGIVSAFVQDAIIIYYLLGPNVRAWFARASSLAPPPPK